MKGSCTTGQSPQPLPSSLSPLPTPMIHSFAPPQKVRDPGGVRGVPSAGARDGLLLLRLGTARAQLVQGGRVLHRAHDRRPELRTRPARPKGHRVRQGGKDVSAGELAKPVVMVGGRRGCLGGWWRHFGLDCTLFISARPRPAVLRMIESTLERRLWVFRTRGVQVAHLKRNFVS